MEEDENVRRSERKKMRLIEYSVPDPKKIRYPRKWTDEDIFKFLQGLKEQGHLNVSKLQEYVPNKTLEEIRSYFRSIKAKATFKTSLPGIDSWLNICDAEAKKCNVSKWNDSIKVAQILKYLSIDGLLESHPLPEQCQGIDFPAAYRLLYQALMGYPIQPVNEKTADFICDNIKELNNLVPKYAEWDVIRKHLKDFQNKKNNVDNSLEAPVPGNSSTVNVQPEKKQIKTYQRKRKPEMTNEEPRMVFRIESSQMESTACSSQSFIINVDKDNTDNIRSSSSRVVDVPVPSANFNNNKNLSDELYQSVSFNPFQIPRRLLKRDPRSNQR